MYKGENVMRKFFIVLSMIACLAFAGTAIAVPANGWETSDFFIHTVTGKIKTFDQHPGAPSQWVKCTTELCGDTPPVINEAEANVAGAAEGIAVQPTESIKGGPWVDDFSNQANQAVSVALGGARNMIMCLCQMRPHKTAL